MCGGSRSLGREYRKAPGIGSRCAVLLCEWTEFDIARIVIAERPRALAGVPEGCPARGPMATAPRGPTRLPAQAAGGPLAARARSARSRTLVRWGSAAGQRWACPAFRRAGLR